MNRLLRRHNKSVYSSLAIRHVTEQIDKLYWDSGAPAGRNEDEDEEDMDGDGVEGGGILRIGSDLRSDAYVLCSYLPMKLCTISCLALNNSFLPTEA